MFSLTGMTTALITGITGQDGSYLAELLVEAGYAVHGVVRPTSDPRNIAHLVKEGRVTIHRGDVNDVGGLSEIVTQVRPSQIYHLAGQTHVVRSFEAPEQTLSEIATATARLLEMVRRELPDTRIFHASSAEIFGNPAEQPQTEATPMRPISPYGCAKTFATQLTAVYRDSLGLFACNGILYNHESPRRGEQFVTRKIARAAARISRGLDRELKLGNVEARRDWGSAEEYARAIYLTLQHDEPGDYIIATGEMHSVREFVDAAFRAVKLNADDHVRTDPALVRPSDPAQLVGDASKMERELGWKATKRFADVVREMVEAEVAAIEAAPKT